MAEDFDPFEPGHARSTWALRRRGAVRLEPGFELENVPAFFE
jgi:hypothetical protein